MGKEEMLPEWLPFGWTMDVKQKKNGKTYKCYTNPTGDLKFYSKPQVLRHLKISMRCSTSKRRKKKTTGKSSNKYVVKHAIAEGLPPGWIKETRVRKKEGYEERTDKYYIDPVSGRVFRSMKEVSRYLETGELGRRKSRSKEEGHVNVERSSHNSSLQAEDEKKRGLMSKDSKEVVKDEDKSVEKGEGVLVTESEANNKVDRDQDMKSGAEDEGVKVTGNKANKEVGKDQDKKLDAEGDRVKVTAGKANKEVEQNQDTQSGADDEGDKITDVKQTEGKRKRNPKSNANTEVVEGQDLKSGPKNTRKRNNTLLADENVQKRKRENDIPGSTTASTSLKLDVTEKIPPANVMEQIPPVNVTEKIPPTNVSEKIPPGNGAEKHGSRTVHHKNYKPHDTGKTAVPRRTSKRLAGVEVDQLLELDANSRARRLGGVQSSEKEAESRKNLKNLDCLDQNIRRVQQSSEKDADIRKNLKNLECLDQNIIRVQQSTEKDAETRKKPKDLDCSDKNIRRVQTGNASDGKRQGPVLLPAGYLPLSRNHEPALEADCQRDEDVEVPLASSFKDFLNDPCIEFAIKTLTGTIPVGEDKSPAGDDKGHNPGCSVPNADPALSLALPSGDLWTDPCFEFAVKTLTGEIPLEDDPRTKTSCQQPLCLSEAQRHNGLSSATFKSESFFPANHSFSPADNPCYRRRPDLVTPVTSRIQNGSSMKFGC